MCTSEENKIKIANIVDNMKVKPFLANYDELLVRFEEVDMYGEFYKAYYIVEGSAKMMIEEKEYILEEGVLLILPPKVHAYYVKNSVKHLKRYWCSFDMSFPSKKMEFTKNAVSTIDYDEIVNVFRELMKNFTENHIVALMNRKINILQILTLFLESDGIDATFSYEEDDFYNRVNNYLLEHLKEKILISDLAKESFVEQSYFTKVFKKHFAVSPNKYINNLKLDKCAELLELYQNQTVEEIALSYGFSDYRYFSRIFKRRYGETPGIYRKRRLKSPHKK